MKLLPLLPLVLAGGVLAWIGHRAGEQTYVPLTLAADNEALPEELSGEVPAGMVVKRFRVTGMCCTGCVGKLYHSLASVEGVEEAAVSFHTETAAVVVPEDSSVEPLVAALTFDKYVAEPR